MRGGEIATHPQDCDEITYAVSGKTAIYSGESCVEMMRSQIHYIKKDMRHRIVADANENFRYICIGFIPNKVI